MSNKAIEIDWKALDKHWVHQYEEDYGNLFGKATVISEYP